MLNFFPKLLRSAKDSSRIKCTSFAFQTCTMSPDIDKAERGCGGDTNSAAKSSNHRVAQHHESSDLSRRFVQPTVKCHEDGCNDHLEQLLGLPIEAENGFVSEGFPSESFNESVPYDSLSDCVVQSRVRAQTAQRALNSQSISEFRLQK